MPTEAAIQQALHARRVVLLPVPNPQGPLELEHLAEAVVRLPESPLAPRMTASEPASAILEPGPANSPQR